MSEKVKISEIPGLTATEEEKTRFKRRLLETADRSYINDRMNVNLPDGLYGEWIGVDDFSQFNARERGFVDGSEFLSEVNKLHDRPDGNAVGDVTFMVIPKWKKDAIDEASRMESIRRSGIGSDAANDEYRSYAERLGLGVQTSERSTGRILQGAELEAHLPKR